jgi:hypothetical protein
MPATTVVEEAQSLDLETFDLSAFVVPMANKDKGNKLSVKDAKTREIEKFLSESSNLLKLGETYEVEVVERGHRALYELLASIYDLALRIDENEYKDKILEAIRKELKDNNGISLKANSTAIAVMVKYVVRSDKVTASRYTKVLTVAQQENLLSADLPDYITRRGGSRGHLRTRGQRRIHARPRCGGSRRDRLISAWPAPTGCRGAGSSKTSRR